MRAVLVITATVAANLGLAAASGPQASGTRVLPDFALPHRLLASVSGLRLNPPQGGATGLASDDGTTIYTKYGWISTEVDLKTLRKQLPESVMTALPSMHPLRLVVSTDSQYRYILPALPVSPRGERVWTEFDSSGPGRLDILVQQQMPGYPSHDYNAPAVFAVSEVLFRKRGPNPNPTFVLPGWPKTVYVVLEARPELTGGVRLLLGHYPWKQPEKGRLEYWRFTGAKVVRLRRSELPADARKLDGQAMPVYKAKTGFVLPPLQVDTASGRALFRAAQAAFRFSERRLVPLAMPIPGPYNSDALRFIGHRLFFSVVDLGRRKERLYVEAGRMGWREVGPYSVVGASASGRYLVLHSSSRAGPWDRAFLVELL